MKWVVGIDLRPSSQGAVHFAAWLKRNLKPTSDWMLGVHVLEEEHLRVVLRYHHLDEVVGIANDAMRKTVEAAGAGSDFTVLEVVQGLHAEKSLEAARVYHHADGLIVGRQAKRDDRRLVRLGRVARRLLRALPAPVIIVPPDLAMANVGTGPIFALTGLDDDSVQACRFAIQFGTRVNRPVEIVHVVALPEDYGAQYLPEASLVKIRAEHQQQGQEQLQAWVQRHGLVPASLRLLQGHISEQVSELVVQSNALMIVCGSRRLSTFDRVLLTSSGSELAAMVPCPITVIPPA